jgi:hypothetical protein
MRTPLISLTFATLAACATTPSTPGTDELAGEDGDGEAAKADGVDTFGYTEVHAISVTGGAGSCHNILFCPNYSLTRANRTTIKCNDGAFHDHCGVHAISWESMGLSQTKVDKIEAAIKAEATDPSIGTQILVKGDYKIFVDFLAYVPTEVWIAQRSGGNSNGTFVKIFDRGIRCITAPCPQFEEDRLNSVKQATIDSLDWGDSAEDALQERAYEATSHGGIIVAGSRTYAGREKMRSMDQVYLPVTK